MPLNRDEETIYDTSNGYERDPALGARSRCWTHYGERGVVLQNIAIRYVDMLFVRCKEENCYVKQLTAFTGNFYLLSAKDLRSAVQ